MKVPFQDLYAQYLGLKLEIDSAIEKVIKNTSFIRGSDVDTFEEEFAKLLGLNHCVSCANGTDALYIAMKCLGLNGGQEVITSAHSWISTSETITQAGGKVVFCDTNPATFTIDPELIEQKINDNTVGIIPVHLYGQAADMDAIMALADKYNLWIIEDCAQAHLATYKGRNVGTFGDIGTFSFYPGKNLGAYGDAGGIVTNNKDFADWLELYARHGGKGQHTIEGINSRLDGIQGAILNVKLPHLKKWTRARRQIAHRYNQNLRNISQIEIPVEGSFNRHVYHLYVIKADRRDELMKSLKENQIETTLNYSRLLPFYPAYQYLGHSTSDFPNGISYEQRILSLPIFPEMTFEQVDYVSEQIRLFYR